MTLSPSAFRYELAHSLGHEGFDVMIASEGRDALEKLRRHVVDGVIAQLHLMNYNGLALILNIRDLGRGIPIIVIDFEDSGLREEVIEAGASGLFRFPVEPLTVMELLKRRGLSKEKML